ncbi:response regulator transcription factor [Actinomyces viscosus]|uniref:Probable transcriptional regulatory protein NarL n=1 Tax=Actinomyces viscosus TaxID=1656 RepID=A0A3S4ZAG3_ACTVI|nr:response regulator transcription factor [Actinomyces viscosus]TFH53426.1 response regulator transcription factor [Actinomyces viscosus]VEI18523.1 Probable transcriptional regulatory protein NarL [Actinomyces viscosus]
MNDVGPTSASTPGSPDGSAGPCPPPGSSGRRVRLLVVDDHPVVRSGIVGMLTGETDLQVVGQAADGAEAIALTAELAPDVVLMDLRMPGLDGVEATRRISARPAAPRVVVLTTYDTDGDILRAVEAGAIGYLLKDSPREDIIAAVLSAAVGRSVLSPAITTRLVGVARGAAPGAPGSSRRAEAPVTLSPRERQVLQAASRGLSNSQIGAELYITEATVKTHLLRAYSKLGVDSRTAAVTEALRRGLLDLG